MKRHILFFLGHPAHYHLFRIAMDELRKKGHRVTVMVKPKDILEDLLKADGVDYINALPGGRKDGKLGIALGAIRKAGALYRFCKKNPPDVMMGTSAEIAWIGRLLDIPSLVFCEDDVSVVSAFARLVYPYADAIVSPETCNNGKWQYKTVTYPGFQKLAYLHPARFRPDPVIVSQYFDPNEPYSLLRFAKLNAHHDEGAKGFSREVALKTIELLKEYGKVYISSEQAPDPAFEPYMLKINPLHMHHIMAFAQVYTGDSQSMAVEAALTGTPGVRFSSFSGKIGVLEELEQKYRLTKGVNPGNAQSLYDSLREILETADYRAQLIRRRDEMLRDKCDVTAFIVQLAETFTGELPNKAD